MKNSLVCSELYSALSSVEILQRPNFILQSLFQYLCGASKVEFTKKRIVCFYKNQGNVVDLCS